jgi:hypothetical protein
MVLFLFLLNLCYSFEIIDQSKNISQCEKTSAFLYVIANADNLEYQWYKDGIVIPNAKSNYLNFENLSYSNSGFYWCIVKNSQNSVTKYSELIQINVKRKTEILNKQNISYVFPEQYFTLKAEINDDFTEKSSKIKWFDRFWNELYDNDTISGANSNLIGIKKLRIFDYEFYCVVDGDCGSDTAEFIVGLYQLERPSKITRTICENAHIYISFDFSEVNNLIYPNDFTVRFYNENNELNTDLEYFGSSFRVTVNDKMTKDKVGKYNCEIKFKHQTYNFELLELSIYLNTVLQNKSEDFISLKEGQDLNLFINASGNIQSYYWFKDGLSFESTNSNSIRKTQVLKEDTGIYTCIVENFCNREEFFISDVEVIENEIVLSINDINVSQIYLISDILGNIYNINNYNDLHNLKKGLYLIKLKNGINLKFVKYE